MPQTAVLKRKPSATGSLTTLPVLTTTVNKKLIKKINFAPGPPLSGSEL